MMQTMLFSEFTDLPHVYKCCGAGHYNPCCTDVIVQGHYYAHYNKKHKSNVVLGVQLEKII